MASLETKLTNVLQGNKTCIFFTRQRSSRSLPDKTYELTRDSTKHELLPSSTQQIKQKSIPLEN